MHRDSKLYRRFSSSADRDQVKSSKTKNGCEDRSNVSYCPVFNDNLLVMSQWVANASSSADEKMRLFGSFL